MRQRRKSKWKGRLLSVILASCMVVSGVPSELFGGVLRVKAAGDTITGWTDQGNKGLTVTANDDGSLQLVHVGSNNTMGKAELLSDTSVLTFGEATDKKITISCDVTVNEAANANEAGFAVGILKSADMSDTAKVGYSYVAYRGKGSIRPIYCKTDDTYGAGSVKNGDTKLDSGVAAGNYLLSFTATSSGVSATANYNDADYTWSASPGRITLGSDTLYPAIFINNSTVTINSLEVIVGEGDDAETVYQYPAPGAAVKATVTAGTQTSTMSGTYDAAQKKGDLTFDPARLTFAADPSDSDVTVTADSEDALGGYSAKVNATGKVIEIYSSAVDSGNTAIASLPYAIEGELAVMAVGTAAESYDFKSTNKIFGEDSVTADAVFSANNYIKLDKGGNSSLSVNSNSHGLYFTSDVTFETMVPANAMGVFTFTNCQWGQCSAELSVGGTVVQTMEKADFLPAKEGTDATRAFEYRNASDSTAKMVLKVSGNSGGSYIHGVSYEVKEIPQEVTVTGNVGTDVAGGTLTFKAGSASTTATVGADGSYSVVLPVGSSYTVELSGVTGYRLQNAKVDLTNANAGATVTGQDFTPVYWNAGKSGTVTIGGTTFTIAPGAAEADDFTVTAAGGDGSVEVVSATKAVVWANLGGAGNGSVSNVTYGGDITGGQVSGNTITLALAGDDLPKSYTLQVKDNSASGTPVKGTTKTYNLGDGSVISELYTGSHKIVSGNSVSSTDKLVTVTGNSTGGAYYNGSTHGIYINPTDTVKVKVAGNATVTFAMCSYSAAGANLTASASAGTITPASAAMKASADGDTVNFDYTGEATELTFTVDATGTCYIHSITVKNEAEQTTTNEGAVTVKPEILTTIGAPSSLTVTPVGQTLNFVQTGGSAGSKDTASFYVFPKVADFNKLELEVKVNSLTGSSGNNYGVWVGAFDDAKNLATAGIRNMTGLRGNLTKNSGSDGAGQVDQTITAGETVKFVIYKADDKFYIDTDNVSKGSFSSGFKYDSTSGSDASMFVTAQGKDTPVYYGLMLAGVDCDVTNMVYYDKDGNVLYDQNAYYNPMGAAPVVTAGSVQVVGAADRTKIDISWEGSEVYGDGKFVLQMSKDGSEWTDVSTSITGYSYSYPVSSDASGTYKFRVCGTLGNSAEQLLNNRNTYVESGEVTIDAALDAPVLTLPYTSPADQVQLSWTTVAGATSYEVWRRSADESEAKVIATLTETSYTDTDVTAEVPYYYYIIAKSADNASNPPEAKWTLPTSGHTGTYSYEDAEIVVTERSYDTVFENKIAVLSGVATAPGTLTVQVNGEVKGTAQIAQANDTFSFADIPLEQGRNDVTLYLNYENGSKTTKKSLNYVYLTNYDYVVDAAFEGTAGDTTKYGVPEYKTVKEALDAVGSGNSSRKVILVRNGDYEEYLDINVPNVSLIGEDSESTIIHCYPGDYDADGARGGDMSKRCAVRVNTGATNFSAENLTIRNDWEYNGDGSISNESADALRSDANQASYINVRILGYQDTLCANQGLQYYYKCYITGNVDFIYGNSGQALLEDCDIVFRYNANKNSGHVTAMKNPETQTYGLIFKDCRVTAEPGCSGLGYDLGRPWGEYAATTFIDCYMSSVINKEWGFATWGGKEFSTDMEALAKTRYYECGSYGAGYMVNAYRRQLSRTQADAMISSTALGWDPDARAVEIHNAYKGSKTTDPNNGTVKNEYTSDTYSAYEGDDTDLGRYDQEGYAQSAAVTGGGLLKENHADYYTVSTGEEFLDALLKIQSGGRPSVIEVTADIGLGDKEIADYAKYSAIASTYNPPLTHPTLLESGVSKINLKGMSSITIFSKNGSTIKHAALDINNSNNIIIRNIVFDELWEWDEYTAGDYDRNDWDYVTVQNGSTKIWIDHCTFYKAYDGIVDIKTNVEGRSVDVTVSWCEFLPGSENNTFFNAMMDAMAADPSAYPYYQSLLNEGMTQEQIWWYAYGQKKTHLLGQADNGTPNENLHVTLANNYYFDSMDRMPRLRFGDAHVYNCIMDAQELYDAKKGIANAEVARHIVSNGASSTCDGRLLVENSYISGILNALNSGNGSSPSGWITAENSVYYVDGTRYQLVPKVNTSKAGEELKVLDAEAFKASLPYGDYVLYDAMQLQDIVKPNAGAGKLSLTTLQWEKTAYYDSTWVKPDDDSHYTNDGLPELLVINVSDPAWSVEYDQNSTEIVKADGSVVKNVLLKVEEPAAADVSALTEFVKGNTGLGQDAGMKFYEVYLVMESEPSTRVMLSKGTLTVVFPYPDGTAMDTHDFEVYHIKNGAPQREDAWMEANGIHVVVDSLSPFAVVYTAKSESPDDGKDEGKDEGNDDGDDDSTPVTPKPGNNKFSPKTFDNGQYVAVAPGKNPPDVWTDGDSDNAGDPVDTVLMPDMVMTVVAAPAGGIPVLLYVLIGIACAAGIITYGALAYRRRKED
ncbi:MAG: pectinesterase family protein [Clostridium sp.]|nr:pectinesterase family protein [Acetatifactor muris]MCM1526112.1 pectinesterase family protein [Bacteroides sp.]MCM1564151.1 pectinesterase family protein [Clostridium sp.]